MRIPLFPLRTVLFPGGPLPLRIFEARYVDMVSRCMKEDSGFGVVAIHAGTETESTAIHTVGTVAKIVDFYNLEDGLLGITAIGRERFRVESVHVQADKLKVGEVDLLAETEQEVPERFRPLASLLETIMEDLGSGYEQVDRRFDDAGWVGCRLAELLPLGMEQKQLCLEMDDPLERLEAIYPLLQTLKEDE